MDIVFPPNPNCKEENHNEIKHFFSERRVVYVESDENVHTTCSYLVFILLINCSFGTININCFIFCYSKFPYL